MHSRRPLDFIKVVVRNLTSTRTPIREPVHVHRVAQIQHEQHGKETRHWFALVRTWMFQLLDCFTFLDQLFIFFAAFRRASLFEDVFQLQPNTVAFYGEIRRGQHRDNWKLSLRLHPEEFRVQLISQRVQHGLVHD